MSQLFRSALLASTAMFLVTLWAGDQAMADGGQGGAGAAGAGGAGGANELAAGSTGGTGGPGTGNSGGGGGGTGNSVSGGGGDGGGGGAGAPANNGTNTNGANGTSAAAGSNGGGGGGAAGRTGAGVLSATGGFLGGFPNFSRGNGGAGGAGDGSGGGGGGGAGANDVIGSGNNASLSVSGGLRKAGDGGAGGSSGSTGGFGGGGGSGGFAFLLLGTNVTATVDSSGTTAGGDGGAGGAGISGGGAGGAGGFAISGNSLTINNNGTIRGGNGGAGGGGPIAGADGAGGIGVFGSDVSITNAGSIVGGLSGDGVTRANAVSFLGGANRLELRAATAGGTYTGITGNVVVGSGTGTLALGGANDKTLAGSIGAGGQYQGFTALEKTGTSTWTLSSASTTSAPWTVTGGTLALDHVTGGTIDAAGTGRIFLGSAGLRFLQSGTLANYIENFGGATSTISAAAGQTVTLTGGHDVGANSRVVFGSLTDTGTIIYLASGGVFSQTAVFEVAGGTLRSGDSTLPLITSVFAAVQVNNGAVLDLNGFDGRIRNLQGDTASTGGTVTNLAGFTTTIGGGDFAGQINGGGNVVFAAPNTIFTNTGITNLSGINGYTGSTTIDASGRLNLVNGGSIAASSGVLNNGTFDISGTTTGTSITTLSGNGGTTLGARTLTITNGSTSYAGVMSGTGGLTVAGGTQGLSGASTYTGPTTINGGLLSVNGSIASAVTVNGGGTLGGTGTVGGVTVGSGGTLAPGNSIGTLNVAGPIAFAPGSFYRVEINAAGQSDRTIATGAATLTGGTVQVQAGVGSYAPSTRYTILTANAGVGGQFAGATSNLAFLTPSLSYDAQNVFLTMTRNDLTFAGVANTRNQAAAGSGADRAFPFGTPIYAALVNLDAQGARQAFDALSGSIHAAVPGAMATNAGQAKDAILSRLSFGLGPMGTSGVAPGTYSAGYSADLPGKRSYSPIVVAPTLDRDVVTVWGEGFGGFGNTRTDRNAPSFDRAVGGFIAGIDMTLGASRIGVAGGYSETRLDERAGRANLSSGFGALYAGTEIGMLALRAGLSGAGHSVNTSRQISFPGFSNAVSARYGGWTAQAFGEVALPMTYAGVRLEPFVNAAAIRVGTDRFTEAGSLAALVGSAREQDIGTVTSGVRARLLLGPSFALQGLVGYRAAFGDVTPTSRLAFAAAPTTSAFTVASVPLDRSAFVTEARLDWLVTPATTIGIGYTGAYGQRTTDSQFKGRFEYRW